jgi:hypothetical protein
MKGRAIPMLTHYRGSLATAGLLAVGGPAFAAGHAETRAANFGPGSGTCRITTGVHTPHTIRNIIRTDTASYTTPVRTGARHATRPAGATTGTVTYAGYTTHGTEDTWDVNASGLNVKGDPVKFSVGYPDGTAVATFTQVSLRQSPRARPPLMGPSRKVLLYGTGHEERREACSLGGDGKDSAELGPPALLPGRVSLDPLALRPVARSSMGGRFAGSGSSRGGTCELPSAPHAELGRSS